MESIVPRSSSQLEPACLANDEYEDVIIPSPDEQARRKANEQCKQQQGGNKIKPMIPVKSEGDKKEEEEEQFNTDEVIYFQPFHRKPSGSDLKYENLDYRTLQDDCSDNQFQDYTDIQLTQMAGVLQNALKQIQGNMQDQQEVHTHEQSQEYTGRFTDPTQRYQNEPRERHDALREHGLAWQLDQKNDSKLDTIFESNVYEPIPEVMDTNPIPVSIEIPPPLPIKRRKLRPPATPNREPTDVQKNVSGGEFKADVCILLLAAEF